MDENNNLEKRYARLAGECFPKRKQRAALTAKADLPEGLRSEIGMVRRLMRLVMDQVDDCASLDELLRLLDTTSKAGTRLGNLLKTDRQLDNHEDPAGVFNQALAEVMEELGFGKPRESDALQTTHPPTSAAGENADAGDLGVKTTPDVKTTPGVQSTPGADFPAMDK